MAQYNHIGDGIHEVRIAGAVTGHIHPCEYTVLTEDIEGYVFVALDGTAGVPCRLLTQVQALIDYPERYSPDREAWLHQRELFREEAIKQERGRA